MGFLPAKLIEIWFIKWLDIIRHHVKIDLHTGTWRKWALWWPDKFHQSFVSIPASAHSLYPANFHWGTHSLNRWALYHHWTDSRNSSTVCVQNTTNKTSTINKNKNSEICGRFENRFRIMCVFVFFLVFCFDSGPCLLYILIPTLLY